MERGRERGWRWPSLPPKVAGRKPRFGVRGCKDLHCLDSPQSGTQHTQTQTAFGAGPSIFVSKITNKNNKFYVWKVLSAWWDCISCSEFRSTTKGWGQASGFPLLQAIGSRRAPAPPAIDVSVPGAAPWYHLSVRAAAGLQCESRAEPKASLH